MTATTDSLRLDREDIVGELTRTHAEQGPRTHRLRGAAIAGAPDTTPQTGGIAMATADTIPQDLPSIDDPKVRLVFEILCDDTLPPNPEHRWEAWYAKRIVAALFPRIGPAQVIPLAPPPARTKRAPGGRTP